MARLVESDMTNRKMSDELMISTETVDGYLNKIYAKLKIRLARKFRARASELGL
jgi:DNA-binding CsgD family transcriptional regulator